MFRLQVSKTTPISTEWTNCSVSKRLAIGLHGIRRQEDQQLLRYNFKCHYYTLVSNKQSTPKLLNSEPKITYYFWNVFLNYILFIFVFRNQQSRITFVNELSVDKNEDAQGLLTHGDELANMKMISKSAYVSSTKRTLNECKLYYMLCAV